MKHKELSLEDCSKSIHMFHYTRTGKNRTESVLKNAVMKT
jgi:hypothetical protein